MSKKTNQQIALEIIAGHWGNGIERRQKLEAAGYSYAAVQSIVNAVMAGAQIPEDKQEKTAPENLLRVDLDMTKYDGLEVYVER